jgi:hypothetical protein
MEVTTSGRPPKINREWFRTRYGQNFPDLLGEEKNGFLDTCIEDVYTLFYGVGELWEHLERKEYVQKTQLCYGLLVSWYITDLFPEYAVGVMSSGGIPLKSKQIGGVKITFGDTASSAGAVNNADLLQSLKSNAFGSKAYLMIKTSGKLNLFFSHGY